MKIRAIILLFAVLVFFTVSAGGVLYYRSMRANALQEMEKDANAHVEELADRIALSFSDYKKMAAALAGLAEVKRALAEQRPGPLAGANGVLDHFQHALAVDACYLIDRSGTTIASSNRNSPMSFVGMNYAFRPYFKQAMEGKPAIYMALGVTSKKRGVYYSFPVYAGRADAPSGVAVIKTSVDYLTRELKKRYDGMMSLVEAHGVIFVSNREEWLFHSLWKLSPQALSEIARSRQFGEDPPEWTGMERLNGQYASDAMGNTYLVHRAMIEANPEWELVFAQDRDTVESGMSALLIKKMAPGVLAACAAIGLICVILYRKAAYEIARRAMIEDEFRSVSHRYQAMINASPLPITIVDSEGIVTLWNSSAEQVFGWLGQDIVGKPLPLAPESRQEEYKALLRSIFEGKLSKTVETQALNRNGALIDVDLSTAPVRNAEGRIVAAMGIYEDITERKRMEEERLKGHMLESIGILAGGLAHDFNNLLSVILGNIAVAKTYVKPEDKAFGRLDDAENVCEMAADLSKRLITFATGGGPVRKLVPIVGLLKEAVTSVLKDSKVTVHYDMPDELFPVAIDEGQMKQVFLNLAKNAREAMHMGGTLTVRAENLTVSEQSSYPMREGKYVKITFHDTGRGIPAESLSKVFDPYYSTKDTYSQKGLGLGLAVCYSIVKRHEGLITAESHIGAGTTFTIYLSSVKNGQDLSRQG